MSIFLPTLKRNEILALLNSIKNHCSIRLKTLSSLLGKLTWAAHAIWLVKPLNRTLYRLMAQRLATSGNDWSCWVRISPSIHDRLSLIRSLLHLHRTMGNLAHDAVIAFSDACDTRGGFVILNHGFRGFMWTVADLSAAFRNTRISIPFLEARALLLCIEEIISAPTILARAQRSGLSIGIDSASVLWAIIRGSSRDQHINSIIYSIFMITKKLNIWLSLTHVSSACNPSDSISRSEQVRIFAGGRWLPNLGQFRGTPMPSKKL